MQQPSPLPRRHEPARLRAVASSCLALAACALLAAGCEEERHDAVSSNPKAGAAAKPRTQVAKKPEFIVGKRTQDIKDANAELKSGQARVGSTRITARDPITLTGNAYVSIIGQTSMLSIQHAVDLYHAANDRYPKDLDEFMNEIIKANNIALPKLLYYQEYGYDANEHKLVILEYEDRKNQPPQ
jgi:hypothetical protein